MQKTIIFDSHIHIYPDFDPALALGVAIKNLNALGNSLPRNLQENGEPIYLLCLTERSDCNFFKELYRNPKIYSDPKILVTNISAPLPCININIPDHGEIYIIPGRQIVSVERIEILALLVDITLPDRTLSVNEIFQIIRKSNGIPVINWAPGKWFFERGKIIEDIVKDHNDRPLLLCDTTLRPSFWPEPLLMKESLQYGVKVLGGSDPLPIEGEELQFGTYATATRGNFDPNDPVNSLRHLLLDPQAPLVRIGARSNPLDFIKRMVKYYI